MGCAWIIKNSFAAAPPQIIRKHTRPRASIISVQNLLHMHARVHARVHVHEHVHVNVHVHMHMSMCSWNSFGSLTCFCSSRSRWGTRGPVPDRELGDVFLWAEERSRAEPRRSARGPEATFCSACLWPLWSELGSSVPHGEDVTSSSRLQAVPNRLDRC